IDFSRDVLVTINPPNNGTVNTTGPLGVTTQAVRGFDIDPVTNTIGYAILDVGGMNQLYTIKLGNPGAGAATLVGTMGAAINTLAISPPPFVAALNDTT